MTLVVGNTSMHFCLVSYFFVVSVYPDSGLELTLGPTRTPVHEKQTKARRFIPDFVLVRLSSYTFGAHYHIRNFCRSVGTRPWYTPDMRNILFALHYAGIPMMNSFMALYAELERCSFV